MSGEARSEKKGEREGVMEGGREGGVKRRLTRKGKRREGVTMRSEEENRTLERTGQDGRGKSGEGK